MEKYRILKYPITNTITNIPAGSKILTVGAQGEGFMIWAMVPVESYHNMEPVIIHTIPTGGEFYLSQTHYYKTIFNEERSLVFHIFIDPKHVASKTNNPLL